LTGSAWASRTGTWILLYGKGVNVNGLL